ncbi:unnamed protein product, partial [Urochloa humidicola]
RSSTHFSSPLSLSLHLQEWGVRHCSRPASAGRRKGPVSKRGDGRALLEAIVADAGGDGCGHGAARGGRPPIPSAAAGPRSRRGRWACTAAGIRYVRGEHYFRRHRNLQTVPRRSKDAAAGTSDGQAWRRGWGSYGQNAKASCGRWGRRCDGQQLARVAAL